MSDDYKIYRVKGHFYKPQKKVKVPLYIEVRASKIEDALEKVYSEIGSRHKINRDHIFIPKKDGIVEISAEEAKEPIWNEIGKEDFEISINR